MSRRFSSLGYAPGQARSRLRDRLNRYLPSQRNAMSVRHTGAVTLPDEALLELLLHLGVEYASDEAAARASYAAALAENSGEPSFEALIEDGWLRVIWGRISVPFEISRTAQTAPDRTLSALKALLNGRFEHTYRVSDEARSKTGLAPVVAAIERRELEPNAIGCQSPEWIAARLWDRAPIDPDKTVALRLWVDRWQELGSPSLNPAAAWGEADALAFWDAATEMRFEHTYRVSDEARSKTGLAPVVAAVEKSFQRRKGPVRRRLRRP
jgi:hypothetical protein